MHAAEFYRNVISSEESAVHYLQMHNLLNTAREANPCHRCGAVMEEKRRKARNGDILPILRCPMRGCQTTRSIRSGNRFFHFTDINNKVNSKLRLCQILELIFYFILELSLEDIAKMTG